MKNNKTKRYKGGHEDERLDENFIINNFKEILNNRPLKYEFDIKKEQRYGSDSFVVFIKNSDEETESYNDENEYCVAFKIVGIKNELTIFIDTIYKCAPISNYGNFILDSFKEFAKNFGYHSILISSDGSALDFFVYKNDIQKNISIELAELSILSTGESWYNRMGFYTPNNREQIQDNLYKISKDIQEIDDSIEIINLIDRTLQRYKGAREKYLPDCYKLINSYGKFRELYDFILNLTNKTDNSSIQEVFQEITNIIKTNCNSVTKICGLDYDTMSKINCFINFVYTLLDIKYKATGLIYIVPKKGGRRKRRQNNKTKRKNNYKK